MGDLRAVDYQLSLKWKQGRSLRCHFVVRRSEPAAAGCFNRQHVAWPNLQLDDAR
jgi:hypothetical protein